MSVNMYLIIFKDHIQKTEQGEAVHIAFLINAMRVAFHPDFIRYIDNLSGRTQNRVKAMYV